MRLHYDRVHAVCRRLAGNDADGADATQEALIAIVRGLPRFDGTSKFSTWAYRVAVNRTLDELRRRTRRAAVSLDAAAEAGPGPGGLPSVGEVDVAARVDVDAALRKLPADFRACVVLRDLCGLDYAEIAEVLSIPPGTVRSRISRARASLVPLLGQGNPDPDADRPSPESSP